MDGEVIIKVTADTEDIDLKMKELENKYKNKKIDIEVTQGELEKNELTLKEMNVSYDGMVQRQKQIQDELSMHRSRVAELVEENSKLDTTIYAQRIHHNENDKLISNINKKIEARNLEEYAITTKMNEQLDKILKQQTAIDKINAKYEKQKNDLDIISSKMYEVSENSNKVDNSVSKTNQTASGVLKKVASWGLAIFGVRSAYLGLRRIMSSVLNQNTKLGDQMSAMGKSFANAFAPVVEKIINLIRTLMAYINYVWSRLFGKNLFSDKVAKDLKSGEKSAKEINKQLAGFDEANVLSDNKSSSGGVGGGTTDIGLANVKIPDWLVRLMDWVKEHPTLAGILFGTAAFTLFGGFKIAGGLFTAIDKLLGGGAGAGATGLLGIIGTMALIAATVVICKVTYDAVKDAVKYYKDLKKYQAEVNDETKDLSTKNMKLANTFVKSKEGTKTTSDEMVLYRAHVKSVLKENTRLIESEELSEDAKKQLVIENEHLIKAYEQLYKQGSLTEEEEYNYYKFLKEVFPVGIDATNQGLKDVRSTFGDLDKKYKTDYEVDMKANGEESVKNSIKKVSDAFGTLADKIKKASEEAQKRSAVLGTGVKDLVSKVFHANGGIVNLPGRGVPVDYAGERGREGIIPMDNESQMQLLGQAIAKYVNINNVVNNYMDARKINSILQTSANNERLANNG